MKEKILQISEHYLKTYTSSQIKQSYRQLKGLYLSTVFANLFLKYFQSNAIRSAYVKLILCKRYHDTIFLIWPNETISKESNTNAIFSYNDPFRTFGPGPDPTQFPRSKVSTNLRFLTVYTAKLLTGPHFQQIETNNQ